MYCTGRFTLQDISERVAHLFDVGPTKLGPEFIPIRHLAVAHPPEEFKQSTAVAETGDPKSLKCSGGDRAIAYPLINDCRTCHTRL
nr:hypothetical protein AXX05_19070 [Tsukamurella tyrosinosolvens]